MFAGSGKHAAKTGLTQSFTKLNRAIDHLQGVMSTCQIVQMEGDRTIMYPAHHHEP